MSIKNKIILCIFLFLILALVIGYFGYGATLINVNDEESINAHIAVDKNKPITILAKEQLDDYIGILYTDPIDSNDNTTHFVYLKKHKLYSNRYVVLGGAKGNTGSVDCSKAYEDGAKKPVFFIYGNGNSKSVCSVFEVDSYTLEPINKLEEINTPENAFIIAKDYELENSENQVFVYDDSLSIDEVKTIMGM